MKKARGGWVASGLFVCCNLLFCYVELHQRASAPRLNRARSSAPTPHRPVSPHWSRAHPKSRRQRRRHAVQRRATVVAALLRCIVQTQPAPPRDAFRIQTLHRSTCQIQHRSSRFTHEAVLPVPGNCKSSNAALPEQKYSRNAALTCGILR
jgi:hypothetical protein